MANSRLCTLSECQYSNKSWIVKSKYTPRFSGYSWHTSLFLLLNIQRLNHRNLLLSRINYHRRSEFTERSSHRRKIQLQYLWNNVFSLLLDDCSNTAWTYCTSTFAFSVILNCTVFSCFWFLHLLIFSIFYCFYDFFQINVAKMLPFTIKT